MYQCASVEGNLPCFEHVVMGSAVTLGIGYFLMEDEIARGLSPFQLAKKVTSRDKAHGGIDVINVIYCQPNRYSFRRSDWPITCVLVPWNVLGFLWEFAEIVC